VNPTELHINMFVITSHLPYYYFIISNGVVVELFVRTWHIAAIFHSKNCFSQHACNLFLNICSRALLCENCVCFSI